MNDARDGKAMNWNVSAWSIRNPIPPVMLFLLLCVAGVMAFQRMKIQNYPDIDLPMVSVSASLPGAAPGQLENEVARKIEDSIATVQGLKHMSTSIQDGTVAMLIEFRLEKPLQEAVEDVRSAVSRVRSDLPGDLLEPVINRVDMASQPILAYTIASPRRDDEALSWLVDNEISRRLLAVRGVGEVKRVGGVSREIRVTLDPLRLQALGATATEISRQIQQIQIESAGGRADLGNGEQPVRTLANVASAEELSNLQIFLSDGRRIRLSDVATVVDTVAERRMLAFLDGKPVVSFEVSRSLHESDVEVGEGVRAAIREFNAANPDLQFVEAFDFVAPTREEYEGSMRLLYEGAFLAVLVVFLFLRDLRATLISALALPLSAIPTFLGIDLMGYTINLCTLIALSLVIGILVDDAIVEVENIVRHLRDGKTPRQAAFEATAEIGLAVVATTFTLVAVFLPTAFMDGVAGLFFKQFGWTATLAVVMSLVVARMITPVLAANWLRPFNAGRNVPKWVDWYTEKAKWCLAHRKTTALCSGAFFLASVALIPTLPEGFMPGDDNSQTQVYLELAPGATLEQTRVVAEEARRRLMGVEHVKSVYTAIGGGSAGADPFAVLLRGDDVRRATLTILLSPRGDRPRKQKIEPQIRAALETLPGTRFKVGLDSSREHFVLSVSGDDPRELAAAALAIERDVRAVPGIGNIKSSASLIRPEIAVRPDFARAADLGVTSRAIADTLRIATLGDYEQALAKLNLLQRQVPILVRIADAGRENLDVLRRLTLPGARGPVMLGEIATLEMSAGPAQITRYDRARSVRLDIELGDVAMGDLSKKVPDLPSVRAMPAGLKVGEVGDAEIMGELFTSFGVAIFTGILCIYTVLVLLFRNFLQPVTLLTALPLSVGGAFAALLLTRTALSMPSLIGILMLMGIATKNSILLIEYAITAQRDRELPRLDALIDACRKRARPIVMTTVAMGAGMMPLALGLGDADTSFRAPMAVTVIGGLITSTVLSLLVVPVVFTYVDDFAQWLERRRASRQIEPLTESAGATALRR
ncbi:MAG: efflux RND transporter permease subunit [Azoarcus sp.]|jgi:multidrug efflux pump subunit AcrB|nr:efflux RND transporter permease subunit [Azoarcus sp.]